MKIMTHPQVFGQRFAPIRRFLAWKTHPFWPHIPNMDPIWESLPPPAPGDLTGIQEEEFSTINTKKIEVRESQIINSHTTDNMNLTGNLLPKINHIPTCQLIMDIPKNPASLLQKCGPRT